MSLEWKRTLIAVKGGAFNECECDFNGGPSMAGCQWQAVRRGMSLIFIHGPRSYQGSDTNT